MVFMGATTISSTVLCCALYWVRGMTTFMDAAMISET